MFYLLFALYFIVFCWLLTKLSFIKRTNLSNPVLIGLFAVKVIAGIVIGWLSLHLYGPGNDYWDVNREGWTEYQLLLHDPKTYFSNIFSSSTYPDGYHGVFDSFHSFWNDLRNNVIIKMVSVFNLFSQGHYYINSLFFNFIIFFGHVVLYRLFIKIFPGKNISLIIACFLLPSFLYFTSGIHKDGVVFLSLAVLCYAVYSVWEKKKVSGKALLIITASLGLLFLMRNFVFLALLPALSAWAIAQHNRRPIWQNFSFVYLVWGLLFFTIHNIIPAIDPMSLIIQRQADFALLPVSATDISINMLQPGFNSFMANAPQSFEHLLLRPYLWSKPLQSLLPFAIELFVYQLAVLACVFSKKESQFQRPQRIFLYFCIFFTLTAFLFIGYIAPNIGSLIRYRSLYLPFIMAPVLCSISWPKTNRR